MEPNGTSTSRAFQSARLGDVWLYAFMQIAQSFLTSPKTQLSLTELDRIARGGYGQGQARHVGVATLMWIQQK